MELFKDVVRENTLPIYEHVHQEDIEVIERIDREHDSGIIAEIELVLSHASSHWDSRNYFKHRWHEQTQKLGITKMWEHRVAMGEDWLVEIIELVIEIEKRYDYALLEGKHPRNL